MKAFRVEEEDGGVEVVGVEVGVQLWFGGIGDIFSSIFSMTWLATIVLSLPVIAPSCSEISWLTASWVDQLGLRFVLNLGLGLVGAGVTRSLAGSSTSGLPQSAYGKPKK